MTQVLYTDKKEKIVIDISIRDPEWERVTEIEELVRISVLCTLNSLILPTKATGKNVEISIVLANDDLLQVLNREYRNKDKPTNVLTFASLDDDQEPLTENDSLNLGDVILSFQTIKNEAREQGKFVLDHLKHLIVHGTLHLLGFDHQNEDDATDMETLEIRILEKMGIQNPYTESIY